MNTPTKQRKISLISLLSLLITSTSIMFFHSGTIPYFSVSESTKDLSFDGAIYPIAFVPDWQKSDYIEKRHSLDYTTIPVENLIPLPKYSDIHNEFNSLFTFLTAHQGTYMDEHRTEGTGSHNGVDIRAPMQTPVFSIGHGKVTKIRDDANNKYVVVEHKNVHYKGEVGTYYSSYLHLDSVGVKVGDIVKKGREIGKVGMTGFTTTPHLHLQIDTEEAPFRPYWPFTMDEAGEAEMSFFDAVSSGLHKERIDLYSINPIDFIENAQAIDGKTSKKSKKKIVQETKKIVTSFSDLEKDDAHYQSIMYFTKKGILTGYSTGEFKSDKKIVRAELLGIVLNALGIVPHGEIFVGIFRDVPPEHWVNPLITEAIKRKILTTERPLFEPNREVTRAEFLAIMALAAGEDLANKSTHTWSDIPDGHWSQKYAQFALKHKLFDDISGDIFSPNASVSRGEIAEAMYRYLKAKKRLATEQ